MKTFGNVIWFIFGGFISWISWGFIGVLWSVTIIGIPVGKQCFKMARLSMAPFDKEIQFTSDTSSTLLNILWIIFGGFALVIEEGLMGIVLCATLIGIPFGVQHFKQARLALTPFGAKIYDAA